jgi:hypothetical protein
MPQNIEYSDVSAQPVLPTKSSTSRSPPNELSPAEVQIQPDPDIPIPSIEQAAESLHTYVVQDNPILRPRTPSVSITPSTSQGTSNRAFSLLSNYETSPTPGSAIDSIADRTANLRLSAAPTYNQASPVTERGHNDQDFGPSSFGQASTLVRRQQSSSLYTDDVASGISPNDVQSDSLVGGSYLQPGSPSPDRNATTAMTGSQRQPRSRSTSHVDLPRHKIEDEEPPQQPFHEISFQRKFNKVKRLMTGLAGVLESSPLHSDLTTAVAGLQQRARTMSNFQCPSTRTVGLVGDSGVGAYLLICVEGSNIAH